MPPSLYDLYYPLRPEVTRPPTGALLRIQLNGEHPHASKSV